MRPHLIAFEKPAGLASLATSKSPSYSFIDIKKSSRWFDKLVVAGLPANGVETSAYPDDGSETFYLFSRGGGELLLPDGSRKIIRAYDGVFFGSGSGGELRAGPDGLEWLAVSTNGGKPTPYADGNTDKVMAKPGTRAAKAPIAFDRRWIAPRQWPANKLGATAKPWWFYTVDGTSSWYHSACISCLPPGGASTFHTHMETYEGPYETFYIVLNGTALIRNEYEDFVFTGGPSGVYVPADASHQIINNGEGLLWYLTLSSRGGVPLKIDVYNMPSGAERPGYLDEYNRIMAARQERGLPLP